MVGNHGTPLVRLVSKLEIPEDPNRCWIFRGALTWGGYGQMKEGLAHRIAHEYFLGPIPENHVVDHECHNVAFYRKECEGGVECLHRRCCNPFHLSVKSQAENLRGGANDWTTKETCRNGHPTAEFRHRTPGGNTYCKECRRVYKAGARERERMRAREHRARAKAAASEPLDIRPVPKGKR